MNDESRRGPRGPREEWGPSRRWRAGGWAPGGPGGPGFGPGRGRGGPRGGRGWGGPGGWGWEESGPVPPVPPWPGKPDFGQFGGPFREFHRHGPGGHRRARRGDVRAAILDLLAEGGARNGYQLIQEIAERTSGVWRPSAGSVYPALQQLEDEGLISPEGEGRRRLYALTEEGRAYVTAHADEITASWGAAAGRTDDVAVEFGDLFRQVAMAAMEVRRAGSASQLAAARRVLIQARRELYLILADQSAGGSAADGAADNAADSAANGAGDSDTAGEEPADIAEPDDRDGQDAE